MSDRTDTIIECLGRDGRIADVGYGSPEHGMSLLLDLLMREPLAPWTQHLLGMRFDWEGPLGHRAGMTTYRGDFDSLSCPFLIHTRDPALIAQFDEAVRTNHSLPATQQAVEEYQKQSETANHRERADWLNREIRRDRRAEEEDRKRTGMDR